MSMRCDVLLFGRNIFKEALLARASISEVFVETKSAYEWLQSAAPALPSHCKIEEGIPPSFKNENHQGIVFRTNHAFYKTYDASELRRHSRIILCNHMEDVHNLGSTTRIAAAFGATLIVHEKDRSASVTPAVVKSSAGCAFQVSFTKVDRLETPLQLLKREGWEIVGLDLSESAAPLYSWNPKPKLAIVLGSEGFGLEEANKLLCTQLIHIPMEAHVESLNVSHAASVVMSWVYSSTAK